MVIPKPTSFLEVSTRSWSVVETFVVSLGIFFGFASYLIKFTLVVFPLLTETRIIHGYKCSAVTLILFHGEVGKLELRKITLRNILSAAEFLRAKNDYLLIVVWIWHVIMTTFSSSWRTRPRVPSMTMIVSPLVFQIVQLFADLCITCMQLAFEMHRESFVRIACLLKRTANFAYLHVAVLFYRSLVQ